MMNTFISGERQYDFVSKFNYVREAGTCGEQRAAETILQELKKENSDAQIRTEEFSFFAPQIKRSFFEVTAPYHKVYEACTFGFVPTQMKMDLRLILFIWKMLMILI